MGTSRLEAFTDGVLAVIITIMVLELKAPHARELSALAGSYPVILAYILSFVNVGHYWINHHRLIQATHRVDERVLWANLLLLFWLSLIPFVISWHDESGFSQSSTALYGIVLGMASISYELLTRAIIAANGADSTVAQALGGSRKGLISIGLYAAAVGLAYVDRYLSIAIYVGVIAMWLIPNRRLSKLMAGTEQ